MSRVLTEGLAGTARPSRPWTAIPVFKASTKPDDAVLAERIRSGDREALGELYDRYASVALATAVRVVADRALAEDVVHDAFVAAWQKIGQFDQRRGALRSWLLTIVRNRARDRVRARRLTIEVRGADERSPLRTSANPTWDGVLAARSATELRAALDTLPAEQRHAVELVYFRGYTYREIADLTGVPSGTASGRLRLALGKLREALRMTDAGPAGT